jgi:hypothetical protein
MYRVFVTFLIVMALLGSACSVVSINANAVQGSGKVASETRNVSSFSRVALQSSGDVAVSFGDSEAVVVSADDNLLPLIQTKVQFGQLIISTPFNTSINPVNPIRISVTMKSLEGISLPGSGSINVSGLQGDALKIDLPGSGMISVQGVANRLDITLSGSGNIACDELKVKAATAAIRGSGNISVNASDSLDASISGSGDIQYSGNPSLVNRKVTGSGDIHP